MDDKKKMTVLLALVGVIFAVGAFNFIGGGSTPPPVVEKKKDDKKAGTEPEGPKNPQVANMLAMRDPFEAPVETQVATAEPKTNTITPLPKASAKPKPAPVPIVGALKPLPLPIVASNGGMRPLSTEGPNLPTEPPKPAISLRGIIVGPNPAAVIEIGGIERVVERGTSIDNDTFIQSIETSAIVIKRRGKTQRIALGGNGLGK